MTSIDPPIPGSYWLPGHRILAGEYPDPLSRDGGPTTLERILAVGIRSFVDLTQTSDPLPPYRYLLRRIAAEREIEISYRRFGIRDRDVPTRRTMSAVLRYIDAEVAAGLAVYVHCWGGVGRTGTVIGCHLARECGDADRALDMVAALFATTANAQWFPEGSPQTESQRAFVREWVPNA